MSFAPTRLRLAINTSVNSVFFICKLENMGKLLFRCRYAAGVFAENYVSQRHGKLGALFFSKRAVFYYVNSAGGVNIA